MNRLDTEFGLFYCFENDLITNHLKDYGAHTRNELNMVLDHIHKDDIVLDIGSHIGTYSIPIAQKLSIGKGHVYCIEADPINHNLLEKNIQSNHLSSAATSSCLLLSDDDNLKYTKKQQLGNSGANHYIADSNESGFLKTMTLPNYLKENNIDHIDFIKMDVEGMECLLLESIKDILEQINPILYVEISREQLTRYGNDPAQIENLLSNMGYSFFMNTYKRNSRENFYAKSKIRGLEVRDFFDVLAIPNQ